MSPSHVVQREMQASEAVLLALVCLSPWAFGSVEAWAQLALEVGIVLLAILNMMIGWKSSHRPRRLLGLPSLALAGLVLLALAQAIPLPSGVLKVLAPAMHSSRMSLVPDVPERVCGDAQPPVALPADTLSLDPEASVRTAAQLAAAWILFETVIKLGGGISSFRRFGLALVGNSTLLALFSLIQSLVWNGKIYWIRPAPWSAGQHAGGPFVCHNHLAAYLNLGLGFALGLLLTLNSNAPVAQGRRGRLSRRWGARLWAAYATGIIVLGILVSHSRGGFLAMIGAAILMLLILRPEVMRLKTGLITMILLLSLFLVAVGSASPFQRLATIPDSIAKGLSGRAEGLSYRAEVWKGAVEAWWAHPIFGTGLGCFLPATIPHIHRDRGFFYFHAENEYLQVLVEGGVVGLGLALLALAGVARSARHAAGAMTTPRDRSLIYGAWFSCLALAIQCLSDFPLHIPGVAVPAVVLAAFLCRLGLDTREDRESPVLTPPNPAGVAPVLASLTMIGIGLVIVFHGIKLARAEVQVARAGLPLPGASMPTVKNGDLSRSDLERMRTALEHALQSRPNWAEGHLRLGNTLLGLYGRTVREWVGEGRQNRARAALLSDPLWLHGVVHSTTPDQRASVGGLFNQEPVRLFLVPAARSFLEARRCSPALALPHLRLASLDYLLEGGDPGTVSVERALRLSGPDSLAQLLAAQLAVQFRDLGLASRAWRKAIETSDTAWADVAVASGMVLSPDQILHQVLPPGGRNVLRFADCLFAAPRDREIRDRFLRTAIERLPDDQELTPVERLWIEAQAMARLDDRVRARRQMSAALAAEPLHEEWRQEFVGWLIAWGDPEEACCQARIGLHLSPNHYGLRNALNSASEAFARNIPKVSDRRQ